MALAFFGRDGIFSAFILLGIVGISQQSGGPPQVKQSSPPRVVKPVGEEKVKLLCNVKDAQNYTWYKNGETILQPYGRYTVKSDRFLRITGRVQKSDSGVFVCVATNNYGSANCTVRLIVEDPTVSPTNITAGEKPQFLYQTKMKSIKSTYMEGDKFTLTCEAKGVPAPIVTWFKNDQIFSGRHRAGEFIATGKYDYRINFPGVDIADAGNYTCDVSNTYGRLTYSYNFNVTENVRRAPQILIIWEQEEPVYVGSNLELFCTVLSKDPKTRYRWYYRDSDVPEDSKLGTLINESLYEVKLISKDKSWSKWKPKLQLKNLSVADSGLYICQAENVVGINSRQTYLNVTRPITPSTTDIKQEQNDSQKHENATDDSSTPSALPELSLPVSPSDLGTVEEVIMFPAPLSPPSSTRSEEGTVEKAEANGLTSREIIIVSTLGSLFIVVAALAAIFFKKHRAGRKPNIRDCSDKEEIEPYATVRLSWIFPLNDESNGPDNNDIPLETLPFQPRTPQEEKATGRTELGNSPYENTDHLGESSVTPVQYLLYQPRYENEVIDNESRKVVIRPGYDKLTNVTTNLPCEYDTLIREPDLSCKSRRREITDTEGEDNMNIHTILEVPS